MALSFEQQERESDKAFAAFSLYLGMGAERSLVAVAAKLGKGKRLMEKWSGRWNWLARVQAHDAHLALVEREAAEVLARTRAVDWVKRREEHQEDEWRVRCELVKLAREAIKRWMENPKKCGTLEGIARLLDLASKLGRLATGMPTDRTEITGEVQTKIDVEWEIALKRVYGRPAERGQVVDVEEVISDQSSVISGQKESQSLLTSAATAEVAARKGEGKA